MQPPRIPADAAQRSAALRATELLFTPSEERFDRITRIAGQLIGTPIALVSLVTDTSQWFKSSRGLGVTESPHDISFCGHAILGDETFVFEDAAGDACFAACEDAIGMLVTSPHVSDDQLLHCLSAVSAAEWIPVMDGGCTEYKSVHHRLRLNTVCRRWCIGFPISPRGRRYVDES